VVGQAESYNDARHKDTDSLFFFNIRHPLPGDGDADPSDVARIYGCRTVIGDTWFSAGSHYDARVWGITGRSAEHVDGAKVAGVVRARTWSDEHRYDGAYSFTELTYRPPR
jgi:hypothetical protein